MLMLDYQLTTMTATMTDYRLPAALIIIGVMLVAALVMARQSGHKWALPQEIGAVLLLCLGMVTMGAAGRIDVETLAAAIGATIIRFLLPNRTPIRSVVAALLASAACAVWGVPALMSLWHPTETMRPIVSFALGLFSLDLVRFALEQGPAILKQQITARFAASAPQPTGNGEE